MELNSNLISSLMLAFVVVVAVMLIAFYWFTERARRFNLTKTDSPDERPEWLASKIPPETIDATQEDGEGITLYDHDPGERLAAPFAEQIEDIARSMIDSDPELSGVHVDFGTAPDGCLEIWIGDKRYMDIGQLPNEKLRVIIRQAVEKYNQLSGS